MDMSSLRIQLIGETALGMMIPGQRGKVLAVVTNAIYLLSEKEELFWLGSEASPMHPRCVRLSGAVPKLSAGSTYTISGHILETDSGMVLDFNQANVWLSPSISSTEVDAIETLPERLRSVYGTFCCLQTPTGLGSLIPGILGISDHHWSSNLHYKLTLPAKKAWPLVEAIARACLARDCSGIMTHANSLVGLGEGLTPSGDDFLGGLLFCRMLLRSAYPNITFWDDMNYSSLFETSRSRTNLISLTLLKDHADGFSNELLHKFANALLTGEPVNQLRSIASSIIKIGHSTGWDLLTGFLTGMLFAFSEKNINNCAYQFKPYRTRKEIQWISNRRLKMQI
jgi:Protein of unknown function (DUF2877)